MVDLSNVSLSELAAATGNLDFGGHKGVNVADPGADQDGATKKYHDDNKYTDAEAVAAADESDKFVERNVENVVTDPTTLKRTSGGAFLDFEVVVAATMLAGTLMKATVESTIRTYNQIMANIVFPALIVKGTDVEYEIGSMKYFKAWNQNSSFISYAVRDAAANAKVAFEIYSDKIDVKTLPIKDIKNHADATLSGTPKIIELLIGSTPYYFKVYPTKT